jgi:cytochrome c oxidase cbb3-type subunit 3
MKFINYLTSIEGIGIYPMISLFIFLLFFILLMVYVFRVDKKLIEKIKSIPFDND